MPKVNDKPPIKVAVLMLDGPDQTVTDLLRALRLSFPMIPDEGKGTYLVACDQVTGFPLSARRLVIQQRTTAQDGLRATTAYKWLWGELAAILPPELVAYLHAEHKARKTLEVARWRKEHRNG